MMTYIQISWDHRFSDPVFKDIFISVDDTACRIMEPAPFSPAWFSHKFHGPGLRYEVGISISSGYIVWINGPFPLW